MDASWQGYDAFGTHLEHSLVWMPQERRSARLIDVGASLGTINTNSTGGRQLRSGSFTRVCWKCQSLGPTTGQPLMARQY
ncbi:hypothetical protein E2C01_073930 [Portunus trituberculatus]|uniref:Uncharacterized protein n=1 Tax=Portunus trituberculatus TaxID=210409 RepID=A0A5B7IFE3_PORTR|nr:hypothetical protein [Portunus trituberculatus]